MLSQKEIDILLRQIWMGEINDFFLPTNLYNYNVDLLIKEIYQGYGITLKETLPNSIEYKTLKKLTNNIQKFTAAKTFQNVKDMQKNVFDNRGFKRSFFEFKKMSEPIYNIYNSTWLDTEKQTAAALADSVGQWQNIEKQKDVLPLLRFQTVGDALVRPQHAEYDGLTRPVNDPIWNTAMPPLEYNCYDDKTEIYTDEGWKFFKDLNKNENVLTLNPSTKNIEWQRPINYIKQKYNDKLVHIKSHNIDVCVTKNHDMFLREDWDRKSNPNRYVFKKAIDLKNGDQIYRNCKWKGIDTNHIEFFGKRIKTEVLCKFFAWYISDGSTTKRNENVYQIKISQSDKLEKLIKDIQDMPYNFYKAKDYIGISDKELGLYLYKIGKCNKKFIPNFIKQLPSKYIRIFLDTYLNADGYIQKQKNNNGYVSRMNTYFTTSCKLADDLGEMILKCGNHPSFSIEKTKNKEKKFKNGIYKMNYNLVRIRECKSNHYSVKQHQVKKIDYDGFVYCVEVPKYHILYIRRNGKCYWCGNCRCIVVQLDEAPITSQKEVDKLPMPEMPFRFNPGKELKIFKDEGKYLHPYFFVDKKYKDLRDNNFGLPII